MVLELIFGGASSYFVHILILMTIYIILALGLNLIIGYTGLLNLGPVAFFGIGAYTSTLLVMTGTPFLVALFASGVLAAIFGVLIGFPSLRLYGDYFAIATLGFAEIVRSILINWSDLTRGPLGIPGIPRPEIFGISFAQEEMFLGLGIVIALFTYLFLRRVTNSGFGRLLKAIREDEVAALSLGKNVNKYKLVSMGVGSGFAGLAGSLFAHFQMFIDPSSFVLNETILMLSAVVLGGLGSLNGSVLGAVIIVFLPEPLRFIGSVSEIPLLKEGFAHIRLIIYSIVLIILMIKRPQGLLGETELVKKK